MSHDKYFHTKWYPGKYYRVNHSSRQAVFFKWKRLVFFLYHNNPKYWDILPNYITFPEIWTNPFYNLLMCRWVADSVDPDQMLHSAASDHGLDCVLGPVYWGWSGGAKVSCILRHRGIQLILAYSWARPAILIAGKGRGGMFLFLLFLFLLCPSLSSFLLSLLSLFSLSLGDDTKWPTRVDVSFNPNTIDQWDCLSQYYEVFLNIIAKTYLYNFDPLKSYFYILKLGFTGGYIIFLISAQKHRLWVLVRTASAYIVGTRWGSSNENPQSLFWAEIWKISEFLSENFQYWWWNFQYIWIGVFS